jgi:hypothetical protein
MGNAAACLPETRFHQMPADMVTDRLSRHDESEKSQCCPKFLSRKLAVTEDASEKPATDCFAAMDRNHRTATVGMPEEVVTPLDPDNLETEGAKHFYEPLASQCREIAHCVTAILCTPINSLTVGFSTSRHNKIASLVRFINTSRDFA